MKKINIKKYLLLIPLIILIITYSMVLVPVFSDEIWEYGYGYNISTGLIPYRDFNMLATPFFPFCIALFIKIFGPYLLSAHIFNAIVLVLIIAIMYKMIGNKTLIIIPILLYSEYNILPTYNGFITFLTLLLIYIKQANAEERNKALLSGLIVSLMVLTKQSVGAVFFILEFFLAKDKKKYLITFSIPIIIFLIYLIINKALYNFIDYSILGMFEFGEKNTRFSIWFIIFIIMCLILLFLYKKHKNNSILYAIAFMSICTPIHEKIHTLPAIILFMFTILQFVNYKKYLTKYFIIYSLIFIISTTIFSYQKIGLNYIYKDKGHLLLKNIGVKQVLDVLNEISNKTKEKEKEYDKVYYLNGTMAYMTKLHKKIKIDKYDMILDGNIGYKGDSKYLKEIDTYCKKHRCLFLLMEYSDKKNDQINHKIIDYIKEKYSLIEREKYFYLYSN